VVPLLDPLELLIPEGSLCGVQVPVAPLMPVPAVPGVPADVPHPASSMSETTTMVFIGEFSFIVLMPLLPPELSSRGKKKGTPEGRPFSTHP
jgi:hypothetical protein